MLVSYAIGNRVVRSKININKNRQAFMRKAKIVDTIGPATESLEGITSLVEAGMDVARLNRSHGTPEDHLKVYNNLRAAAKATGRNVAALVDLQGPKIRCGWFKKNADGEDKVQLTEGQEFVITTDDIEGDEHITSTTFKGLPGDCHAGDPILIDDGKVRLEVTKVEGNNVYTKVVVAGPVSSHKGINLPGVAVSLPALTEKDEEDLRWAIRTGADIIAIDGFRGGTGAAPTRIRDNVGIPIELALAAVDQRLRDEGIRNDVSLVVGGSIRSASDVIKAVALGADACYVGTAALLALGCHLCQSCQTGKCNWGIATQRPELVKRLNPETGKKRLVNLMTAWNHEIKELMGGMGINSIEVLRGNRLMLRGIGLTAKELEILGISHAGE